MCLIFTCGEHTFRKEVEGYEGLTCQCHNCGNYAAHVIKSNPWFTFCFIVSVPCLPSSLSPLSSPLRLTFARRAVLHVCATRKSRDICANSLIPQPVLPLSFKGYHDVVCHVCNFAQPLENRPDVMNMKGGGNNIPLQNKGPHQGWGSPPPQGQPPMQYK